MKLFIISVSLFVSSIIYSTAFADSSCGLDKELIGTNAIGSIGPRSLANHKYEYEPPLCELNVFETPAGKGIAEVMPCNHFMPLREDNLKSDYYRLKVFDADDIWVQISLKNGEKKWAQQKSASPTEYSYQHISNEAPAYVGYNIPTQTGIYDEPRLDAPARYRGQQLGHITDDWIDHTIPLGFFNHDIFKVLESYGIFNSNHIEAGKLVTHYGNFLYAAYDVKAIIKDNQGREWLKAEEYLDIAVFDFWHFVEKALEAEGKTLSQDDHELIDSASFDETFRSEAGQTVYFPYREPLGTITMVMTDGPDCD